MSGTAVAPTVSIGNPAGGLGHYVDDPFAPGTQVYAIPTRRDPGFNPYSYGTTSFVQTASATALPTTSYVAPTTYAAPTTTYAAPTTSYVAPATTYAAPTTTYAAPTTSYIAPMATPRVVKTEPASAPPTPKVETRTVAAPAPKPVTTSYAAPVMQTAPSMIAYPQMPVSYPYAPTVGTPAAAATKAPASTPSATKAPAKAAKSAAKDTKKKKTGCCHCG